MTPAEILSKPGDEPTPFERRYSVLRYRLRLLLALCVICGAVAGGVAALVVSLFAAAG